MAERGQREFCKREASELLLQPEAKRRRCGDSDHEEDHSQSDSESSTTVDAGSESVHHGSQTPSTPQSAKHWPSLKKTIQCTFAGCSKTFNRQAKLRDHLRYHTGDRPFKCLWAGCGSSFPRKTHLDRHTKSAHTGDRDYPCSYEGCDKAFSTGTRLRRHEVSHEKRVQFRCGECGQEFRKHNTLQKHVSTDHQGEKPYVCDKVLLDGSICKAGFDRSSGLKSHQARIHSTPRYTCTVCSPLENGTCSSPANETHTFATYSELQEHNLSVHPPVCHLCGVAYPNNKQVGRHLELDHGILVSGASTADSVRHICPEPGCDRAFTKNGNLQVHIRSVHRQARPFTCGKTEYSLLNNIHGWTGEGACMRDFKTKSHLEEHVRTVHLGLDHRHKTRRQARRAGNAMNGEAAHDASNAKNQHLLGDLTGTTHATANQRSISCLVTGCDYAFVRQYDLDLHLRLRHGLDDNEVQIARLSHVIASQADDGTVVEKATALYDFNYATTEDCREKTQAGFLDPADLEDAAVSGGEFWIGGCEGEPRQLESRGTGDCWSTEQAEMHELIGEGHGWEDDIVVDPRLDFPNQR